MTTYAEEINAARRLAILQALYFSASGEPLNRAALRSLVERAGYVTSIDKLALEIDWLAEMGLVERLELDFTQITARGEDMALGRSKATGVRPPAKGG